MTETDDTDVLLIIPPDFFVVPSSDDSSLPVTSQRNRHKSNSLRATVVNTLIAQVHTLQNRIALIESQSDNISLDTSYCRSPSKRIRKTYPPARNRYRMSGIRGRFSMSNENLKHFSSSTAYNTPHKHGRRPFHNSLPSTPSTITEGDDGYFRQTRRPAQEPAVPDLKSRYDPSGNSIDSLNTTQSSPKYQAGKISLDKINSRYERTNQSTPIEPIKYFNSSDSLMSNHDADESSPSSPDKSCEDSTVLAEIDNFLKSVNIIKTHLNCKNDTGDSSVDFSFLKSPGFQAIAQKHLASKAQINTCRAIQFPFSDDNNLSEAKDDTGINKRPYTEEPSMIGDQRIAQVDIADSNSNRVDAFKCQENTKLHSTTRITPQLEALVEAGDSVANSNEKNSRAQSPIQKLHESNQSLMSQQQIHDLITQTLKDNKSKQIESLGNYNPQVYNFNQDGISINVTTEDAPKNEVEISYKYEIEAVSSETIDSVAEYSKQVNGSEKSKKNVIFQDCFTVTKPSPSCLPSITEEIPTNKNESHTEIDYIEVLLEPQYGNSNHDSSRMINTDGNLVYSLKAPASITSNNAIQHALFVLSNIRSSNASTSIENQTNAKVNHPTERVQTQTCAAEQQVSSSETTAIRSKAENVLKKHQEMLQQDHSHVDKWKENSAPLHNPPIVQTQTNLVGILKHNNSRVTLSDNISKPVTGNTHDAERGCWKQLDQPTKLDDINLLQKWNDMFKTTTKKQSNSNQPESCVSSPGKCESSINTADAKEQMNQNSHEVKRQHAFENEETLTTREESHEKCDQSRLALLSLSNLWGTRSLSEMPEDLQSLIQQKLEEERFRREHCERLIEALQVRLLESQEKLSVAIKVDAAKDNAISKLRDTCLVSQERCLRFQTERDEVTQEVDQLKKALADSSGEIDKKINHYEAEISKALAVACQSQAQAQNLQKEMEQLKLDLDHALHENKLMTQKAQQFEKEILQDKLLLNEARANAADTKQSLTCLQSEFTKISLDKASVQRLLTDEQLKNSELTAEKKTLQQTIEEYQINQGKIQQDNLRLLNELEKTRVELRAFYQQQVDIVVKDKLKEFQDQLDTAEKAFYEQVHNAKLGVAQKAVACMQETVNKHKLEICLLEERHAEERKLHNLKYQQAEHIAKELRAKLHQQRIGRAQLASRLHDLMETQWREAMKLLSNTSSPVSGSEINLLKPDSTADIQKLLRLNLCDDFLKSESNNPLQQRKNQSLNRPHSAPQELPTSDRSGSSHKDSPCKNVSSKPSLSKHHTGSSTSIVSDQSDLPFGREGQLTYRSVEQKNSAKNTMHEETPISTRTKKKPSMIFETDLQKYMKLLLDLSPRTLTTNTANAENSSGDGSYIECRNPTPADFKSSEKPKNHSTSKHSKPPWK